MYLYIHGTGVTSTDMINLAKNFQWFPVAVLPTSWYRSTKATLDLGGIIPFQADPTDSDTVRNLVQVQLDDIAGFPVTANQYNYHWRHFSSFGPGYRDSSCTTGSWPDTVAQFLMSGNPRDYFNALDKGMGELNTRPQWMSGEYKFNTSMPFTQPGGYCGPTWRYFCGWENQYPIAWKANTQQMINARDDQRKHSRIAKILIYRCLVLSCLRVIFYYWKLLD